MNTKLFFKKTVFMLMAMLFSIGGIQAQCDHTDDLSALPAIGNFFPSETSPDGWELKNSSGIFEYEGTLFTGLSGHKKGAGQLTSPVFTSGCKSLSFSWDNGSNNATQVHFKVELLKGENSVWSKEISVENPPLFQPYVALYENLDIEGEVQLRITNLCPSSSTQEYDDVVEVWDFCIMDYGAPAIPTHTYEITAPKDATVFVGEKDQSVTVLGNYLKKHYIPFTEKPAVAVVEKGSTKTWYYNVSRIHNYRVSREGSITQVGTFLPSTVEGKVDTVRVFTEAQLTAYSPKEIDHDVNSLEGRNIADVLVNINAQGHLKLPLADTAFQIINCRNWQAIDTDVNNYFIDPDFHYTVVNESGAVDNSVVTISDKGLITPVGAGTAIVLVTYDAMVAHHILQGSIPKDTPAGSPVFFSALWPENTAVFVVTVDGEEAGIKSNMLINQYWSELNAEGNDKVEETRIDAEHDVLYYEASKGSFAYTFKPEGVSEVLVATPAIGANITSYSGFGADSVTVNPDGSYTVKVTFGRNIVKLVSDGGKAAYQVLTAKPVTWEINKLTTSGSDVINPGDTVSVKFNTLYHPANKLSGIYNMSAGIQYTGEDVNFPLILGPGQYTFASRAQEYKITIPKGFDGNEYVLKNGVLKVRGFGSYYGEHRNITQQNGVEPNLNASIRTAYFGSLPEISIPLGEKVDIATTTADNISVYPNPFANYIIVNTTGATAATIYNLSGTAVVKTNLENGSNRIETSALPKGIYLLKAGENTVKIVK